MLNSHLGGCGDNYKWTQTEEEIMCEIRMYELIQLFGIHIDLNKDNKDIQSIKSSLKIIIDMKNIKILLKEVCVFAREFSSYIDSETATWYFDEYKDGEPQDKKVMLVILVEKKRKGWWDSCFLGESKVDLSEVQGKKNFRDCDERTKSEILKLINSNNNNNNNNTNSHYNVKNKDNNIEDNLDIHEVLKQSWNKENSPFQGIEYDPNLVQKLVSNSINQTI
ncbi:uncharacterized protein cubi_00332 [Cryptosporidium ubiquitum]|uniref:CS domain-containing protein n=1 Tax=Cryptosporidium ubiquitum TaxID=857276 RepID=A0A1J4MMV7_9CRYT|nr:uncharacterized protein cubi_00332 [Cryptosporidium ubiquitum]OII74779.1 hypothetical protein cubi_00332 [Cryptosporidium ubiquitum]